MDQVALTLGADSGWTYLGGDDEARKDLEVVVRAFDRDVLFAIGTTADAPGGDGPGSDPVTVPNGEGRRLVGRHFFVRPATAGSPCRITQRGL